MRASRRWNYCANKAYTAYTSVHCSARKPPRNPWVMYIIYLLQEKATAAQPLSSGLNSPPTGLLTVHVLLPVPNTNGWTCTHASMSHFLNPEWDKWDDMRIRQRRATCILRGGGVLGWTSSTATWPRWLVRVHGKRHRNAPTYIHLNPPTSIQLASSPATACTTAS